MLGLLRCRFVLFGFVGFLLFLVVIHQFLCRLARVAAGICVVRVLFDLLLRAVLAYTRDKSLGSIIFSVYNVFGN